MEVGRRALAAAAALCVVVAALAVAEEQGSCPAADGGGGAGCGAAAEGDEEAGAATRMRTARRRKREARRAAAHAAFEDQVPALSDTTYFALTRRVPAVAYLYADWSAASDRAKPAITALAADPPGDVAVFRLPSSYKANPAAAHAEAYPTVVYLDRGDPVAVYELGEDGRRAPGGAVYDADAIRAWAASLRAESDEQLRARSEALRDGVKRRLDDQEDERIASARAREDKHSAFAKAVPEVTRAELSAAIGDAFVMVYSDGCGEPCRKMEPIWTALAGTLKGVRVARMLANSTSLRGGAEAVLVRGYPSLLYYRAGLPIERFQGAHDTTALEAFVDVNRESTVDDARRRHASLLNEAASKELIDDSAAAARSERIQRLQKIQEKEAQESAFETRRKQRVQRRAAREQQAPGASG